MAAIVEPFYYWGQEGSQEDTSSSDQSQLILALSQQVAELQARVDELSEKTVLKGGAMKPARMRVTSMTGIARMGMRKIGTILGIPSIGVLTSIFFSLWNMYGKALVAAETKRLLKEAEAEDLAKRKQIIVETVAEMERERRETYRSLVP
jgi:hypothetical protein